MFQRSFQGLGLRYKGLLVAPCTLPPAGPLLPEIAKLLKGAFSLSSALRPHPSLLQQPFWFPQPLHHTHVQMRKLRTPQATIMYAMDVPPFSADLASLQHQALLNSS